MTSQSKMVAFDLCEVLRKIEKKPIYWGGDVVNVTCKSNSDHKY